MRIKFETGVAPIINIDDENYWSLDETLATIIHPLLVEFRKRVSQISFVTDGEWIEKLDTMIYTFEKIADDTTFTDYSDPKIKEGLANFSTFYYLLWD